MANALVRIRDYDLPTPSSYIGLTADLVDAGRNAEGTTIGSVVREDVAKVEITYNYLTVGQWSAILKLFKTSYGGSFSNPVTFYDQVTADWVTRNMYIGDRTTSGMFRLNSAGNPVGWDGPKLQLIEV